MYSLKAPPVLVSQRVYHNIKCSAQFLLVHRQCSSYKGILLSHYLTMSHLSDQVKRAQLNVFLQSLPEAFQPFTVRISCYLPEICMQMFAFFSKAEAEAVNPCEGLQTPCHHAWLSWSSGPVKLFFSSLIFPHKPQSPMHHCGFILLLLIFTLFSKMLLRSLSFTLALLFSAG